MEEVAELLTFNSTDASLGSLTSVFIVINQLNYNTEISGKVM